MKTIVLSGINLFSGGTLSIYKDLLTNLIRLNIDKQSKIIAFVHKKDIFSEFFHSKIEFIELPKSRKNYFYRCYYEYHYFYKYSKKNKIDIWISMHDMTPKVIADKRYVYCHNSTLFLNPSFKILRFSPTVFFMSIFYKYIYKKNIKKNTAVIVQQSWMAGAFEKIFNLKNIIIARPTIDLDHIEIKKVPRTDNITKFVYPSYPRVFKNFEIICEACSILEQKGVKNIEIFLTIDGTENKYSRWLYKKYHNLKFIKWIGLLSRSDLFKLYADMDCMIFPSTLETWGLPISEFKLYDKPIICADLPYAYETIGDYNKAIFCINNKNELAHIIENLSVLKFAINRKKTFEDYKTFKNWEDFITEIVENVQSRQEIN